MTYIILSKHSCNESTQIKDVLFTYTKYNTINSVVAHAGQNKIE